MSPSPDDDLTLSQQLETFADTIAAKKNTPGLDDVSWKKLDDFESDLRAQASELTVEAVTESLKDAGSDLTSLQGSIKDAQVVLQKIADAASTLRKIAGIITIAGTVVSVVGAASSGNVNQVIADLKALPAQVETFKG